MRILHDGGVYVIVGHAAVLTAIVTGRGDTKTR